MGRGHKVGVVPDDLVRERGWRAHPYEYRLYQLVAGRCIHAENRLRLFASFQILSPPTTGGLAERYCNGMLTRGQLLLARRFESYTPRLGKLVVYPWDVTASQETDAHHVSRRFESFASHKEG